MALRLAEISRIVSELNERLVGAFVQKAHAPAQRLAYLELRQPGRTVLLCLSAQPESARLSVAQTRPRGEPTPFQRWLRQELVGAKLEAVSLRGRCAVCRFARRELGRQLAIDFAVPALLLLGPDDRVIATEAPPQRGWRPGATYVPPDAGEDPRPSRLEPVAGDFPFGQAAEALLGTSALEKSYEGVRRNLLMPLRAKLARLERTVPKVKAEAERQPKAEEHRRYGQLLSQNVAQVPRGAAQVELTEYSERGVETVRVPLDPARAPKDQAERHFHQYRRLMRGSEAAAQRLRDLEHEREELRREIGRIEALDDAALAAIEPNAGAPRPPRAGQRAAPFRQYLGSGCGRIWVGKHGEGNDELTFHRAKPGDLWLHARGVPGSHVVVPLERSSEVPQELLLDAAHLALHHSSLKGEPRGEVSHTRCQFVRRVKGGAPGQVTFTREKTFVVRIEPARLERLLKTEES